jgi:ABC-type uncharacterized transport system permease subunit
VTRCMLAVQGYITNDMATYVGTSVPITTSFVMANSGANFGLNVTVTFPGNAAQTSQVRVASPASACPCTAVALLAKATCIQQVFEQLLRRRICEAVTHIRIFHDQNSVFCAQA